MIFLESHPQWWHVLPSCKHESVAWPAEPLGKSAAGDITKVLRLLGGDIVTQLAGDLIKGEPHK